jgi:hypothetical protein
MRVAIRDKEEEMVFQVTQNLKLSRAASRSVSVALATVEECDVKIGTTDDTNIPKKYWLVNKKN